MEDNILEMAERNPTTSVQRISDRVAISRIQVWRNLHDIGRSAKVLQPADYTPRVDFCHWLLGNQQLRAKILFTDEATLNRDGMTNTRNSYVWSLDNSNASTETHFQRHFSGNIWYGVIGSQVIRTFVLEEGLASKSHLHFLKMS
jgi:hypothetical protein